jgi:spore germination protein KB
VDNKQITSHQLYALTATISLGGSILVSVSTVSSVAKAGGLAVRADCVGYGIPVIFLYYFLGSKYPGMTLIASREKYWENGLACLFRPRIPFCFYYWRHTSRGIPAVISGGSCMKPQPTISTYSLSPALLLRLCTVLKRLRGLRRSLSYFFSAFFGLIMVLLIKDIKIVYVTPSWKTGFYPREGLVVHFTLLHVCLNKYPDDISASLQRYAAGETSDRQRFFWAGAIWFASVLMSVLILGSALTAKASFPTLLLAAEINVGAVITRLEYILTIIWLFTQFMIELAFFYSGITALSELLGLKDHKKIAFPFGLVALVFSGIIFPNTLYQGNWVNTVYTPMSRRLVF